MKNSKKVKHRHRYPDKKILADDNPVRYETMHTRVCSICGKRKP